MGQSFSQWSPHRQRLSAVQGQATATPAAAWCPQEHHGGSAVPGAAAISLICEQLTDSSQRMSQGQASLVPSPASPLASSSGGHVGALQRAATSSPARYQT